MGIPEVGALYRTEFHLTRDKVMRFAEYSGDDNPVHLSGEMARRYGFTGPVAHGAILMTELSRIIGTELPGYGALWTDIDIEFKNPVFWDEVVTIEVKVLQCSAAIHMVKLQVAATKGTRTVLNGTCNVICLQEMHGRLPMPTPEECIVMVTGGSKGLGLEVTREMVAEGRRVVTISRHPSAGLNQLQEEYPERVFPLYIDLMDRDLLTAQLTHLTNRVGDINMIVHAAGPIPEKSGLQKDLYDQIQVFLEIYLRSFIDLLTLTIPAMKRRQFGRIVTIGTSFILGTPPPSLVAYVTAKEALWGFTKSLAVEYGKYGITANMVSPSMMITEMTADISNAVKYREAASNPLQRLVETDEVAKVVGFLCSEAGSFINGTNLPITGGKF